MVVVRVVRGPTAADRLVASDLGFFVFISMTALVGARVGSEWVFDIVLVAALVGFIATVWLARMVGRSRTSRREEPWEPRSE
ncbi:pesticidal protein Cry26Aa [Thermobifida halotolerans]|uniref:Pesticidal protein Cry26Aa n=2 Tax=Thermobifida halotolerans TaxID=483545 RepID=A0AA97M1T3_9ACTN|nr:pesticidal protein Cry26Aa [Thermobifida halotolerans]